MNGFMKITPYYGNNVGSKFGTFTTQNTDFTGKTLTKELLNSAEFKQALEDLSFYVNVTSFEVEVNIDVKSYQMVAPTSKEKAGHAHYHSSDGGYTIKADCITVDRTDGKKSDLTWIYTHFKNRRPVNIIVDSKEVKNGVYDISKFEGFKLVRPNVYEFSVEFTTYRNNTPKLTNKVTVTQSKLKQCTKPKHKVVTAKNIKNGYYYKKKGKKKTKVTLKQSSCLGYMNKVLKKKGCYPTSKGKYTAYKKYNKYFTKYSVTGLKNYGKKWNKKGLKPKVNEKGKLSKKMWEAIKRYPEL